MSHAPAQDVGAGRSIVFATNRQDKPFCVVPASRDSSERKDTSQMQSEIVVAVPYGDSWKPTGLRQHAVIRDSIPCPMLRPFILLARHTDQADFNTSELVQLVTDSPAG